MSRHVAMWRRLDTSKTPKIATSSDRRGYNFSVCACICKSDPSAAPSFVFKPRSDIWQHHAWQRKYLKLDGKIGRSAAERDAEEKSKIRSANAQPNGTVCKRVEKRSSEAPISRQRQNEAITRQYSNVKPRNVWS
ncbi:hypothetical protein L596_010284 [Steinernema carpocapsae]|uniref:Uncharacterized protein n=1 Tax=Steinernema carpocapsae TaxID=34508 RepID=A0A4V6A6Z3_STECR|nr:hypothetical protein L596_010284 [Steinernema carpocapsae]